MTPQDFVYWLRGFIELNETAGLTGEPNKQQWTMIKAHLDLVFTDVTSQKVNIPKIKIPCNEDRRLCNIFKDTQQKANDLVELHGGMIWGTSEIEPRSKLSNLTPAERHALTGISDDNNKSAEDIFPPKKANNNE